MFLFQSDKKILVPGRYKGKCFEILFKNVFLKNKREMKLKVFIYAFDVSLYIHVKVIEKQ